MRIGIFGSACDPPHLAHIAAAEAARKALKLNRLMLIPTKAPPHKAAPAVLPAARLKMARLAVKNRPFWCVSDMEIKRPGKSYTKDTIKELRRLYPHDELYWIIGSDSLVYMPRQWKGGYEILNLCKFVVVPRRGYSLKRVPKSALGKVIVLKGTKYQNISSAEIRKLLKRGVKIPAEIVARPVQEFIKNNNLYR